jgi:alkyl hydroperoxide reductase subunit AhpC
MHINQTAPDFTQHSTKGDIHLYDYLGDNWGILFSHPKDFTPVCTTELSEVAKLLPKFQERHTKVLALSVDPLEQHNKWVNDIEAFGKIKMDYPIIADEDRSISLLYDMIHPEADDTFTVRSVFFIDPKKKVRLILTYPAQVGRNFQEILRSLDALQKVDKSGVATPVNWQPGDKTIVPPSVKDANTIKEKYGEVDEIYPYLRYTEV